MKIITNLVKTLSICVVLVFSTSIHSQESNIEKDIFVRVFNIEGKKIGKGRIAFANDTILKLKKGKKNISIEINKIGSLKTKRSGGNSILVGSIVGMSVGAVLGASTTDPDTSWWLTPAEGATAFGLLGVLGGGAVGGIVAGSKNMQTFIINGDEDRWLIFKEFINK